MKKMLLTCAALALAATAAHAAEVTSSNIVGYQKLDLEGQFATISATFVTVGAETWRLGDVVANGMDPFGDTIQVLSLTDAKTIAQYTYIDEATAAAFGDPGYQGWWDATDLGGVDARRDDVIITAGQGLLCNISSLGVTFTYSGELLQGATEVPLPGQFAMLSNFLPVDITLGDIEASGMDPFGDTVQALSLSDAKTLAQYTYIDAATAVSFGDPGYQGWWDATDLGGVDARRDNVVFKAGSSMLCNVATPGVTFVFPDPLTVGQ